MRLRSGEQRQGSARVAHLSDHRASPHGKPGRRDHGDHRWVARALLDEGGAEVGAGDILAVLPSLAVGGFPNAAIPFD